MICFQKRNFKRSQTMSTCYSATESIAQLFPFRQHLLSTFSFIGIESILSHNTEGLHERNREIKSEPWSLLSISESSLFYKQKSIFLNCLPGIDILYFPPALFDSSPCNAPSAAQCNLSSTMSIKCYSVPCYSVSCVILFRACSRKCQDGLINSN